MKRFDWIDIVLISLATVLIIILFTHWIIEYRAYNRAAYESTIASWKSKDNNIYCSEPNGPENQIINSLEIQLAKNKD